MKLEAVSSKFESLNPNFKTASDSQGAYPQPSEKRVILNLFQDLIRADAVVRRFRHEAKPTDGVNKFGMTPKEVFG